MSLSDTDLRANLFRDREHPGDWRVEKPGEDGAIDIALFSGGDARERAIRYAEREYGRWDEIELEPYRRGPALAQTIDDLAQSGISASIEVQPGLFVFHLGDTGAVEGAAHTIDELAPMLRDYAIEHFPDSEFAARHRRGFE